MNKRQRKKAMRRVFGRRVDPATMNKIGEVVSEFIRAQLARPSPIRALFAPLPKPPFARWRDDVGVVHFVGTVTDRRWREVRDGSRLTMEQFETPEHLVVCTMCVVSPIVESDDVVVTCVPCQAYESERPWAK